MTTHQVYILCNLINKIYILYRICECKFASIQRI